jgi:hypothetical protein
MEMGVCGLEGEVVFSSLTVPSVPRHVKIGLNSYRDIMTSHDDISGVTETLLDKCHETRNNIDQSI